MTLNMLFFITLSVLITTTLYFTIKYIKKQTRFIASDAATTTVENLLNKSRLHPLVGQDVYYRHSGRHLGTVLSVDHCERAYVLRYDGVIVRRKLHRIATQIRLAMESDTHVKTA